MKNNLKNNLVFVAIQPGGRVGYFGTPEEIPEGWKRSELRDITNVMNLMRCTKAQALAIMNDFTDFAKSKSGL